MRMTETIDKAKRNPKVVVFGNEVDDSQDKKCYDEEGGRHFHWHNHHHYHSGGFAWGFFLILAGLLFLFNTLNILPWSVWNIVGRLWPIIIILIGVDVVFGRSLISRFLNFFLTFFIFATALGIIFLKVSPGVLTGLPSNILIYLHNISSVLQIK